MRDRLTNSWFYSKPNPLIFMCHMYVKGDMLVLLPFVILLAILLWWNTTLGLLVLGLFLFLRGLGEMIYWLLQQFVGGKYRPYDYGFKNLDNNAIYIIYQLTSMLVALFGITFVLYILFF